jgi:hypothetical protein
MLWDSDVYNSFCFEVIDSVLTDSVALLNGAPSLWTHFALRSC